MIEHRAWVKGVEVKHIVVEGGSSAAWCLLFLTKKWLRAEGSARRR